MRMIKAFAAVACAAVASIPTIAQADESGISFWIPGTFGSLAATPLQPGWTAAAIYYHTSVSAGGDVARAREIQIGRIPANLTAKIFGFKEYPFFEAPAAAREVPRVNFGTKQ